jgi:hypothetical protein
MILIVNSGFGREVKPLWTNLMAVFRKFGMTPKINKLAGLKN